MATGLSYHSFYLIILIMLCSIRDHSHSRVLGNDSYDPVYYHSLIMN